MLLFISLICIAVPHPSWPGFRDRVYINCSLRAFVNEHEHWYLITPKSTYMLLLKTTRPSQLSRTLPEKMDRIISNYVKSKNVMYSIFHRINHIHVQSNWLEFKKYRKREEDKQHILTVFTTCHLTWNKYK